MSKVIVRGSLCAMFALVAVVLLPAGSASAQTVRVTTESFHNEVLHSDRLVVVDFTATWCPPCGRLAPVLERFARNRRDIKVVKVDVDENPSLAERYGVTSLPTLMFFYDGRYLGEVTGFQSYEELTAIVDRALRRSREIGTTTSR